ncbi:aldo/keto reductase [Luteimonas yindakuii]|nr:aldo/keto reductase [Luteimonas yindakuii]
MQHVGGGVHRQHRCSAGVSGQSRSARGHGCSCGATSVSETRHRRAAIARSVYQDTGVRRPGVGAVAAQSRGSRVVGTPPRWKNPWRLPHGPPRMNASIRDPQRRRLLQGLAMSTVALALPTWARAATMAADDAPILRAIPSSGERIPVVGLGANAYGVQTAEEKAPLREVLQRLAQVPNSVIDTAPSYRNSEAVLGELIEELGLRERFFIATKVTAPGGDVAAGIAQMEASFRHLRTDTIDLMMVHNLNGAEAILPTLLEWKQAGRLRHIGITTSNNEQHAETAALIRAHPLDVVQVNYSLGNRAAEDIVFPAAQERGTAVVLNVPLGGRRGSLFGRVRDVPLPDWAAESGASSWAQLFLKYNLGHPAVTAVLPGTTRVSNLEDNLGAGRGALPDAAQRRRIEVFWDALPE